jgi:hypothetical protein
MGCVTMPKGFLKLSETSLEKRQLQMRQYDTTNEEQILTAIAGVLQDLGFTLDSSETKLGFVAASKKADATNGGQVAGAAVLDILAALSGSYSNAMANCDRSQVVKASIITRLGLDGKKITVRVTFQRIVTKSVKLKALMIRKYIRNFTMVYRRQYFWRHRKYEKNNETLWYLYDFISLCCIVRMRKHSQ